MTGKAATAKDGTEALGAGGEVTGESPEGADGTVEPDGVAAMEGVGEAESLPVTLMASF